MSRKMALDISAIIHLASMTKNHSSSFRFAATLTETVDLAVLQSAMERVVPRIPGIAAGIKAGFFRYEVVPVKEVPKVKEDQVQIATFSKQEMEKCAFRVLYKENQISLECFHALTDGFGAIVFLKTLLAEYFKEKKNISVTREAMVLGVSEEVKDCEIIDDYYTYASPGRKVLTGKTSYQKLGKQRGEGKILFQSLTYHVQELLAAAKKYEVSLNVFLAAIMIKTIADMQSKEAVQIMVPMNMRNLFPSKTLRNFILTAYTGLRPEECNLPFQDILMIVKKQLAEQMGKEHLAASMEGYVAMQKHWLVKMLPLCVQVFAVKIGHYFMGLKKSCITFTNLGVISFPEEIAPFVEKVNVYLTPRQASMYNCGIISCGEYCHINFARLCKNPELETAFQKTLEKYM